MLSALVAMQAKIIIHVALPLEGFLCNEQSLSRYKSWQELRGISRHLLYNNTLI